LSQFSGVLPVHLKSMRNSGKYYKNGYVGGVGITALKEQTGNQNQIDVSGFSISTAYFTQVSISHFLSFGLQLGVINKVVDQSTMTWGTQYDPELGHDSRIMPTLTLETEKVLMPVANFGVTWHYNNRDFTRFVKTNFRTFTGFAVSNLNKPNQSYFSDDASQVPMLFKLHGGFSIPLSDKFEVLPNYIAMRQSGKNQINLGAYVAYYIEDGTGQNAKAYQIQLGNWYRFGDSYIVSLGVEMKKFILGISYDITASQFKYYKQGVSKVEVSLTYTGEKINSGQQRRTSHPLL